MEEIVRGAKSSVRQAQSWEGAADEDAKSEASSGYSDRNDTIYLYEGTWLYERYRGLEKGGWSKPASYAWQRLLQRDELLAAQARGEVLHGYREPTAIGFPPSYRRVRGAEGDCYDYTDPQRVRACFTTTLGAAPMTTPSHIRDKEGGGDEEDPTKQQQRRPGVKIRVPSYTDRIWYVGPWLNK